MKNVSLSENYTTFEYYKCYLSLSCGGQKRKLQPTSIPRGIYITKGVD